MGNNISGRLSKLLLRQLVTETLDRRIVSTLKRLLNYVEFLFHSYLSTVVAKLIGPNKFFLLTPPLAIPIPFEPLDFGESNVQMSRINGEVILGLVHDPMSILTWRQSEIELGHDTSCDGTKLHHSQILTDTTKWSH